MNNIILILIAVSISNCTNQGKMIQSKHPDGYITTSTGLQYKILTKGSGSTAKEGQEVMIRETTAYLDGTVLYSNENSKSPVKVLIGGNQATGAVDEGLRGMQVGEVRQLIAKPELVKRKSYPANVSPDSTLKIKLILISIIKPAESSR
jgi:FKBP-type peptidyl-prolyl cis-trans isomerase